MDMQQLVARTATCWLHGYPLPVGRCPGHPDDNRVRRRSTGKDREGEPPSREKGRGVSFFFLSTMDSQPQLMDYGNELLPPEKWKECKGSQLFNLGSDIFYITKLSGHVGRWQEESALLGLGQR
jgi:hypothetical protein